MSQTVIQHRFRSSPVREGVLAGIRRHVLAAYRDAVTRQSLSSLDARGLSDIGISRAQAQFVAERPIWELVPFLHR